MQNVEALHQAQEVAHLLVGARTPSAVGVRDEGGATDRKEVDVVAPQRYRLGRIPRPNGDVRRRQRHVFLHHAGIEAHHHFCVVHLGAGAGESFARVATQHLHSDLGEHSERCMVDCLDLVLAQDLDRRQRVDEIAPREARDCCARRSPLPSPASPRRHLSSSTRVRAGRSLRSRGSRPPAPWMGIHPRAAGICVVDDRPCPSYRPPFARTRF